MTSPLNGDGPSTKLRDFTAFAQLLQLRSGGQLNPSSIDEFDQLDDLTNDEVVSIADTVEVDHSFASSDSGLRKRFLDRLSELFAKDTGGPHVSSAMMREDEKKGEMEIWLARNSGFASSQTSQLADEENFIHNLETSLGLISRGGLGKAFEPFTSQRSS